MTASIRYNYKEGFTSMSDADLNIPIQAVQEGIDRIEISDLKSFRLNGKEVRLHAGPNVYSTTARQDEGKPSAVVPQKGAMKHADPKQPSPRHSIIHDLNTSPLQKLPISEFQTPPKRKREDDYDEAIRKFYGYNEVSSILALHRRKRKANQCANKRFCALRRNSVFIRPGRTQEDGLLFPATLTALNAVSASSKRHLPTGSSSQASSSPRESEKMDTD